MNRKGSVVMAVGLVVIAALLLPALASLIDLWAWVVLGRTVSWFEWGPERVLAAWSFLPIMAGGVIRLVVEIFERKGWGKPREAKRCD